MDLQTTPAPQIVVASDTPQTDLAGLSLRQLLGRYTMIVAEIDHLTAEIPRLAAVDVHSAFSLEDRRERWMDRRDEIFDAALPLKPANLAEAQAKARVLGERLVSLADDSDDLRVFLEAMAGPLDQSRMYDAPNN